MAKTVLNARVYLAQLDVSGVSNAASMNLKTDIIDATCMKDAYKDKLVGMTDIICDVAGVYSDDDYDATLFTQLSLSNKVLTLCTEGGVVNTTAFFFKPLLTEYTPLDGKISELGTYKLHGEGTGELVRGKIMIAKGAKTLTGTSTPYQLGALSSSQTMVCAYHVFAISGTDTPTITLILQSDAADTFLTPADQITFAAKTTIGDDYQSKAGPVTDTWWRLSYTISGTNPSFTIAVVAGII